jgi:predicted permease
MVFINVVLPVIFIFLTGYALQKWKRADIKSLSTVAIYVMTPSLVFHTFYNTELDLQYLYIIIFSLLLMVVLWVLNKGYCKLMGHSAKTENALALSTVFMNSGNYGTPLILFAYGETAFAYAISIMVAHALLMNSFGVYIAARGDAKAGMKTALQSLFKLPTPYAVIVALFFNWLNIQLPANLLSAFDLVAQATIPTIMIILGMQMATITSKQFQWGSVSYGVLVRLLISPLVAFCFTLFVPIDPLLAKVLIVSSAMPSAATMVMYSVQFDTKPQLVSSITLVSTLASILTLSVLLTIL